MWKQPPFLRTGKTAWKRGHSPFFANDPHALDPGDDHVEAGEFIAAAKLSQGEALLAAEWIGDSHFVTIHCRRPAPRPIFQETRAPFVS